MKQDDGRSNVYRLTLGSWDMLINLGDNVRVFGHSIEAQG